MRSFRFFFRSHAMVALTLLVATLAMRALIPTGWMPDAQGRGITLCTDAGMTTAWIDADGVLHKDAPAKAQGPCIFAALGHAADFTPDMAPAAMPTHLPVELHFATQSVAIGRGLAAPPPPKTGPPLNT